MALCGYDGEHAMPDGWECVAWKARGGYGSQGDADGSGRANSARERIWFSPYCLRTTLFSELMGTAMRDADEYVEMTLEQAAEETLLGCGAAQHAPTESTTERKAFPGGKE